MKRLLYALPILAAAFFPISATASTSLSPTLEHVLAPPPAGFSELGGAGVRKGHLKLHDYAAQTYGVKATEAERLLGQYGFVDSYTMPWIQQGTGHVLIEMVVALDGGRGAKNWLAYDKASGASDPHFQHADTIAGIDPYYGEHMVQTGVGGTLYIDAFTFVKGNDEIGVAVLSTKDDALSLAVAQAKTQYAAAPATTIAPWLWPENAGSTAPSPQPAPTPGTAFDLSQVIPYALVAGSLIAAAGLAAFLFLVVRSLRRRRPKRPTAAAVALQMSADGNFWYDGRQWISTELDPPPFAQRSPDGSHWWDGYRWRPVPPPLRAAQLTRGR